MVEVQGGIVPETEAEYELLMTLLEATADAHTERGVPEKDIAQLLNFAAMSVVDSSDGSAIDQLEREDDSVEKAEHCPQCGEEIESVRPFIGGDVEIDPCGCSVEHTRVAGWIDDE